MEMLLWIILGVFVGIIAHSIDPAPNSASIKGSVMLGILGAIGGGILANILIEGSILKLSFSSFLIAITGALLLLFVGKSVKSL